jgi:hypothetical protein
VLGLEVCGHSYFQSTVGTYDQASRVDQKLRALTGVTLTAFKNRALTGACLTKENPGNAGWATVLQQTRRPLRGAPYPGRGNVYVDCWGINDIGLLVPSGDTGTVMTQIRTAFKNSLRAVISRQQSGTVYEAGGTDEAGSGWSFNSGWTNTSGQGASNSGNGWRNFAGTSSFVNNVATFTIPADFPGGWIALGFQGAAGAFGGTVTLGGTAGWTGTVSTSNIMPAASGSHGHVCVRKLFTSSNAGQTITITATATDTTSGTSNIALDYLQIEAVNNSGISIAPLVVVCNAARATVNSAYASYASSYWSGTATPGSTGDTDIANLNTDIASVIAEFPAGTVIMADIDAPLNKTAALFASDGIHPNELGAQLAAQVIRDAILAASGGDVTWATDARDAGAMRSPRRALCWDFPDRITGNPTFTTLAMVNLSLWAWPLFVTEAGERWDMVSFEVTTASTGGGGLVRFALYDDEDQSCYPQCLVQDWGTVATTATGIKTLAINWPPDVGLYWLTMKVDSVGATVGGTLRAHTGTHTRIIPYSTAATPASLSAARNHCYTATSITTGAFAQTFPTTATPLVNTTACPVAMLRHAVKV